MVQESRFKAALIESIDIRTKDSFTPGLQAKARIVMLRLAPDGEAPVDTDDTDVQLAWLLCRNLLDKTVM